VTTSTIRGVSIVSAELHSAVVGSPHYSLTIQAFDSGAARVRILEKTESWPPRWESPDVIQDAQLTRTALSLVKSDDSIVSKLVGPTADAAGTTFASFSCKDHSRKVVIAIRHDPLRIDVYSEGSEGQGKSSERIPVITVNGRGSTYFEHRRKKVDGSGGSSGTAASNGQSADAGKPEKKIVDWDEAGKAIYDDGTHAADVSEHDHKEEEEEEQPVASTSSTSSNNDALWEENFQSHSDSKPFGPTSVGVDISFPSATFLYGIPEHASSHALKATDGSEGNSEYNQPYRLYNLDVFEYELDNPMALYGSIPMILAHRPAGTTAGAFWNNPTETYVDIKKPSEGVSTRWISESGVFDLFLMTGPSPKQAISQFTQIVGTQGMPPLFALGYHQCRWNYKDETDVYQVDAKFEEHAFPYDVLWLDIEHTDGKRYFTWEKSLFPDPIAMQNKLNARGHKMVTIIDPHMKRDNNYKVHSEASSKQLYVRQKDGQSEYEGWCWPGSSSYLDFTNEKTRDYWADQFSIEKYAGSTLSLYTWNDMNEPSVFNGPEVSMHKDAKSIDGVEHREWHNLYGFYQVMATHEGQLRRDPSRNSRSFVLSRAFYAGSQKYGAIWTGDNHAKWEHLKQAAPMLLTIGVAGLTFSGADVGGFFQNPTSELMVRWYQAGSWQPFFRSHAHIDTQRREPWLFGDDTLTLLRNIVITRYSYLPLWYTLFAAANATGVPTMRPMWLEFPTDISAFGIDDQWMVGDSLLVKPVTGPGESSVQIYLPSGGAIWYDTITYEQYSSPQFGGMLTVDAPLNKVPVLQRGGSIVPRQLRPRRSSALMKDDPYTIIVTLDARKHAQGQIYLDDGNSYDFATRGSFRLRQLSYAAESAQVHTLKSTLAAGSKIFAINNEIERIVIAGVGAEPKKVVSSDGTVITFTYSKDKDVLTLRKPGVKVSYDFAIRIEL